MRLTTRVRFITPSRSRVIEAQGDVSDGNPRAAAWARFRTATALRLGVDPRALATLRILIGLLILLDLLYRVPHLGAFHSDAGVVPRSVLTGFWSEHALHSLSGAAWFQGVLFIVQAVVALALLVGYRTRLATIVSVLLLVSLQVRNPFVVNAGDLLLRVLLFWGIFLHLGARWSVDALKRKTPTSHIADIATAGVLLQVVVIYVLNAYHKVHGGDWASGEALQYVFQIERYMAPLGVALNTHADLLASLTRAWFGLLLLAPLLLITTGRVRVVLVGLFASAHLGMFLTMRLGFFPLVSIVALVPFLPSRTWDLVEHRVARPLARSDVTRRVLESISHLHRVSLPRGRPAKDPRPSRAWRRSTWANGSRSFGASVFLGWILLSASLTADLDILPKDIQDDLEPHTSRWAMFAVPGRQNTWIAVPATLESGRAVDALHLDEEEWTEARYLKEPYPDFRWRKYLDAIKSPARDDLHAPFAAYLCERWNDAHEDKITSLVIYRVDQPLHLDGTESAPARTQLRAQECA